MGSSSVAPSATTTNGAPDPEAVDRQIGTRAGSGRGHGVEAYVCEACGYGIRRVQPPPRCPMCHGSDWRLDRGRRTRRRVEASAAEVALTTLAKRGDNRVIYELGLPSSGGDPVGFLCECADPDCHKVLWFTTGAFSRASADPAWHALAPGHQAATDQRPEHA